MENCLWYREASFIKENLDLKAFNKHSMNFRKIAAVFFSEVAK